MQWIKWNGGKRPVSFWDRVKVKLRDGLQNEGYAGDFVWGHLKTIPPSECDIIAYKGDILTITERDFIRNFGRLLTNQSSGRESECCFTSDGKAPWNCKYVYDPTRR